MSDDGHEEPRKYSASQERLKHTAAELLDVAARFKRRAEDFHFAVQAAETNDALKEQLSHLRRSQECLALALAEFDSALGDVGLAPKWRNKPLKEFF